MLESVKKLIEAMPDDLRNNPEAEIMIGLKNAIELHKELNLNSSKLKKGKRFKVLEQTFKII